MSAPRQGSAFASGLVSVAVQALIIREALFGIHQAELASGLIISSWLLGAGAGAVLLGKLPRDRLVWGLSMIAMPVLAIPTVIAARLGTVLVLPLTLACGVAAGAAFIKPFKAASPSRIYSLEAAGAVTGGIAFLFASSALLVNEMLLVCLTVSPLACLLGGVRVPVLLLAPLGLIWLTDLSERSKEYLLSISYQGFDSLSASPSPYGEVVLAVRSGQSAVYRSGLLETYWPGRESAESRLVVPLLVAMPRSILYTGSSVEEMEMIDSWPGVLEPVFVLPDESLLDVLYIETDGVLEAGDGRAYIESCEERYDLIVVSAASPLSLLGNRLYTWEMMRAARSRLTPQGALSIHLEGGQNRLSRSQARLAASVLASAEREFDWVLLYPLGGVGMLMGMGEEPVLEGSELYERLDSLDVSLVGIFPANLLWDISRERVSALEQQIAGEHASSNRDLNPTAFLEASISWQQRTGNDLFASLIIPLVAACLAVGLAMAMMYTPGRAKAISLASIGLAGISVETGSILLVQSTLGYSYVTIGVISAAFMLGASVGARSVRRPRDVRMLPVQLLAAGVAAVLALFGFLYDSGLLASGWLLCFLSLSMILMSGFLSGRAFPIAAAGSGRMLFYMVSAEYGWGAAGAILVPLVLFPGMGAPLALLAVSLGVALLSIPLVLTGRGW